MEKSMAETMKCSMLGFSDCPEAWGPSSAADKTNPSA